VKWLKLAQVTVVVSYKDDSESSDPIKVG